MDFLFRFLFNENFFITLRCYTVPSESSVALFGLQRGKKRKVDTYMTKAFFWRFVLWLLETSQSSTLSKSKATWDVHMCVIYNKNIVYKHTAWASALLLVLDKVGNAKASSSGTSNRDETPALLIYMFSDSSYLLCQAVGCPDGPRRIWYERTILHLDFEHSPS